MNASRHDKAWMREIARRSKKHLWLKAVGTTVFMSAFFVGYFHLQDRRAVRGRTGLLLLLAHRRSTANPGPDAVPGLQCLAGRGRGGECLSLDARGNGGIFPIWLDHLLREMSAGPIVRAVNWCWFVLIAYSTLAIKQHVALDVLAGLILGVAFALPSVRFRPIGKHGRIAA